MIESQKPPKSDIHPRQAAEKALGESEEIFSALVSAVEDYAIFALDPKGLVLTWNVGAHRVKGYTAKEIIGSHFSRFYTPEDIARHHPDQELETATREGKYSEEGWRVKKDGSQFWAAVTITALKDAAGKLRGFAKVTRDLTDRKRAEDQLRAATDRLEKEAKIFDSALSASPDFYYIFDPQLRFTYVNRALLNLWKKSLEEVIGKNFSDLGYPSDLVKIQQTQLNEVLTGKTVRGENSYTNFEGKTGFYEYVFVPIFDDGGRVQAIAGTTRDVTERKKAEDERLDRERLRESEAQLRMLANSIPQLAWMANPDGYIFWYNQRWHDYAGTTPEQMAGWGWQSVHDPKILPLVLERWQTSIATGTSFELEFPLRAANGSFRWFLTRVEPLRDASGRIIRWFGTNTDIDEQRRIREMNQVLAEASATFSQSLDYEKTLESLAKLIVSKLADWCSIALIRPGNEPIEVAVAHPDPERLKKVQELFRDYPTDWNAPTGAPNVIRTGKSEIYPEIPEEILKRASKDSKHFDLLRDLKFKSAMIVPLTARGRVLGTITFISSDSGRKYSEDDLTLAEEIGRRAAIAVDNGLLYNESQRSIRARDEFLSIASHELRTPLTALKLQAQIRKRTLEKGNLAAFSPERLVVLLNDDERQVTRLTRLVEDMLDVSRLTTGKFQLSIEDTDLGALVREVIDRFTSQLENAGIEIEIDAAPGVVGEWDRCRIEQVFTNLLTNAMKYGGGKAIYVGVSKVGEKALLIVRDQGIGIADEDRERIFKQFERAVSPTGVSGLGLGLYIAKQLVEAHQGQIRIDSKIGQGSTFTVELLVHAVKESVKLQWGSSSAES